MIKLKTKAHVKLKTKDGIIFTYIQKDGGSNKLKFKLKKSKQVKILKV